MNALMRSLPYSRCLTSRVSVGDTITFFREIRIWTQID